MDNNLLEGLLKVKEKISNEKNWTKHTAARNNSDLPVCICDKEACKFCLIGAVMWVEWTYFNSNSFIRSFLYKVYSEFNEYNKNFFGLAHFNDLVSHTEVMNFLDKCISKVKSNIKTNGV